jgi:hypothetical protein
MVGAGGVHDGISGTPVYSTDTLQIPGTGNVIPTSVSAGVPQGRVIVGPITVGYTEANDTSDDPSSPDDSVTPIIGEGNMRLDDDGSGPDHGDTDHSNFTSYYSFYGVNLNADTVAYVVVPAYALSQGVMVGDLAFVIGNGTWTPAIVGDVDTLNRGWGEVSLRTAWNLGVPTIDAPGGVGPVIPNSFGPVHTTVIVIPTWH